MKQVYSEVLQFRGNHYDYGLFQGRKIKDSMILKTRNKDWKIRRPRFEINIEETKSIYNTFAPRIWDEIEGLRDGLELPMEDVLLHYGGYRIDVDKSGCSILTDKDYMIRNYDFHPQTYEGLYSFFQPSDGGNAIIGPSSRVIGRMDGMNEYGLVMGYNFTNRRRPGTGFTCTIIGRMILETCKTVDEAVNLLKDIPHRGSFSYVLLDKNEKTRVVEASPRSVEVRESDVCTNHFEILKEENRYHLQDSFNRINAITEAKDKITDGYEAFQLMNGRDRGVFSEKYKSWSGTIHTSAYFPKEKKVWFAIGGDRKPFVFDFDSWLKGNNILVKKIHGKINTDLSFANFK
ncbi:C45 family autoproteolytic acyltransferase/hydrolase [Bacillaceae bacterium W0354]